jgi:hypothetical protein
VFVRLFVFQLFQVLVVNIVSPRNVFLVPSVVSCFVSADQQNCCTARIERIKDPVWVSLMLNPEFPHMPVP